MEITVVHIQFKKKKTHEYFGSIPAIFDSFSEEEIGATHSQIKAALWKHKIYTNDKVIIRRGKMRQSKQKNPSNKI